MTSRRRKATSDGAIVIEKTGELIVKDGNAVFRWFDKAGALSGIAPKARLPAFVEMAEHFGRLTPDQATSLHAQLSDFRVRD